MEPERDTFWGWPGRANLVHAYVVLGVPVCLWFALVYGGCDYLTGLHDYRVPLYFAFELSIPFVPATVLFYHSLHLAYSITPFVLCTRAELNAIALVLVLIILAAAPLFLILPFDVGYAEPTASELGPWRMLYELADEANLRYNSFPSLHVGWSILCLDVFAGKAGRFGKVLLWLWGAGLMASTVLLHQHHLVDVAGGFALALIGSRILYPRLLDRFQQRA
jgi:membrane-associated phospholipid phosphatase